MVLYLAHLPPIMSSEKRTHAVDLSHHVSDYGRRYAPSPLKDLQKYYDKAQIVLAGGESSLVNSPTTNIPPTLFTGLPSPEYFPFNSVSANVLPADAFPLTVPRAASSPASTSSTFRWLWRIFGGGAGRRDDTTIRIEVPREPQPDDGGINLSKALQYGPAIGLTRTQEIIHEFTERVYAPAYDDWTTLIHTGNTDGYVVHIIVAFGS